jgi:hypothetical protein
LTARINGKNADSVSALPDACQKADKLEGPHLWQPAFGTLEIKPPILQVQGLFVDRSPLTVRR